MASSFSNSAKPSTESPSAPHNGQGVNPRRKEKVVFTQTSHLNEILEKVRELSASCALYEETWTDDQENRTLICLIGKVLSVIPAEKTKSENLPETAGAEDRCRQVVRTIKQEDENIHASLKNDDDILIEPQGDVQEPASADNDETHAIPFVRYNRVRDASLLEDDFRLNPAFILSRGELLYNNFRYEGRGVFTTCVPSATGEGTHVRWRYPKELANNLGHPSKKRSRNDGQDATSYRHQPYAKRRRASGTSTTAAGPSSQTSSRTHGQ